MKVLLTLLLWGLLVQNLWAQNKVGCGHVQVCNLLAYLHPGPLANWQLQAQLPSGQVDPHHFRPSVSALKAILKLKYFIFAAPELSRWAAPVAQKRLKKQLHNYILRSPEDSKGLERSSLSHFWLDPKTFCTQLKQVTHYLKEQRLQFLQRNCPNLDQWEKKQSALAQKFAQTTIVLSHDALYHFFKALNVNIIVLKHSHHHSGATSKVLKQVQKAQKTHPTLLWIDETSISGLSHFDQHIRAQHDKIIKLDTLGQYPASPLEVLEKLYKSLEEI